MKVDITVLDELYRRYQGLDEEKLVQEAEVILAVCEAKENIRKMRIVFWVFSGAVLAGTLFILHSGIL